MTLLGRTLFSLLLCVGLALSAIAAEEPALKPVLQPLWPDGDTNNPATGPRPTLELYRPIASSAHTDTVVIIPGGGYGSLSPYDRLLAEFFRSEGYAAAVINYRVLPHRYPAGFADVARAVRLLRKNAAAWKMPLGRLILVGESAGGQLAALLATQPDLHREKSDDLATTISARPDRLILLCPVISAVAANRHPSVNKWLGDLSTEEFRRAFSPDLHVTKDSPPAILFHAADDPIVSVDDSLAYAQACWKNGVPAELHVFPHGGHGRNFTYAAKTAATWHRLVIDWLASQP